MLKYETLEEDQVQGRGDEFRFEHADFEVFLTYPQGDSMWVWSSEERSRREFQICGSPARGGYG